MSKEMTREEKNKMIAEFMGWEPTELPLLYISKTLQCIHLDSMKFHISWAWLMPVVEKIAQMEYTVKLITDRHSVLSIHNGVGMNGHLSIPFIHIDKSREGWTFIQTTYEAVYQFITWYNQQPTTQTPQHHEQ